MVFKSILLFLCCLIISINANEQCLVAGGSGESPPVFMNYPSDDISRIIRHNQAIIASYKFQCCGNVTEWGVDVRPDGGKDDMGLYTLDLQVWRPSPTVDDSTGAGQYSLVGKNIFPSITLTNRVASLTPSPRDYIQFQSGDVLGFYVAEARESGAGVPVLSTGSFSSYSVWHASVGSQYTATMVSAGTKGELSELLQAAPVVTVSSMTFRCLTTLTSIPYNTSYDLVINSTRQNDNSSSEIPGENNSRSVSIPLAIIGTLLFLVVCIVTITLLVTAVVRLRTKIPVAANLAYSSSRPNNEHTHTYPTFATGDSEMPPLDGDSADDFPMTQNKSYSKENRIEDIQDDLAQLATSNKGNLSAPNAPEIEDSLNDNQAYEKFATMSYEYISSIVSL